MQILGTYYIQCGSLNTLYTVTKSPKPPCKNEGIICSLVNGDLVDKSFIKLSKLVVEMNYKSTFLHQENFKVLEPHQWEQGLENGRYYLKLVHQADSSSINLSNIN